VHPLATESSPLNPPVGYNQIYFAGLIQTHKFTSMKSFVRHLLVLIFLAAIRSEAQPASSAATNAPDLLPASSPYGEARVFRNIAYVDHPTPRQNFDLYLPKDRGNHPSRLIIWIHGGAWMSGIKEWDNVKYLVQHGYAIATLDYRITPENTFPAQIQDCNAALNFILAHAADYGISSRQFVVAGASAGGHLALLLGLARQEKSFGADPAIKPPAILDFFGPTDLDRAKADTPPDFPQKSIDTIRDALTKLLDGPPEKMAVQARWASPINYVSPANPPVLILHGSKDDLVPPVQSQRLKTALTQAGVKNELIWVNGAPHDGPLFSTPEIQTKVLAFLDEIFGSIK
jgi:acetyl esterase/lipase